MHILTVNQGYPEWVGQNYINNLQDVGYRGNVIFFNQLNEPICSTRMFAWLEFVKTLPKDEFIILSDLRDVVFQDNPEKLTMDGLHVFMEDGNFGIGDEPYNRSWILQGWGEEGLNKMRFRPIYCAGVTFGRQPDIEEYLQKMCRYLEQPQYNFAGADQGVHNWMIANQEINCQRHSNNTWMVYTVGLNLDGIKVKHHKILNEYNETPIIVHQYDRHLVGV